MISKINKTQLIGYRIFSYYSDSQVFVDNTPICGKCMHVYYNIKYFNLDVKPRKKGYDFSCSFDDINLASPKFIDFFHENNYQGFDFIDLHKTEDFKIMITNHEINKIEVDMQNSRIKSKSGCDECGGYSCGLNEEMFTKDNTPVTDGFHLLHFEVAYSHEYIPSFVIGLETYKKIRQEKLRGFDYAPLYKRIP